MLQLIRRTARVALVSVLLVVLAGSVVRMTGSGMGCPDWPKCFGYLIPPTDESTVQWKSNWEYKRGQMIVHEDALLVASQDFSSSTAFDDSNWAVYEKHDYAVFNVLHTWIEYINRLLGAFSGLPVLLLLFLSLFYLKKDPLLPVLAFAILIMLGFEAWLGKVVVDSNLAEYKISLHMGGALLIVALILILLRRANSGGPEVKVKPSFRILLIALLIFGLVQIGLGTQVREGIDEISKSGVSRESWIDSLGLYFIIHRSFAWIVIGVSALVVYLNRKNDYRIAAVNTIGIFVLAEVLVGVVLSYAGMPALLQPTHLAMAFLMFAFTLQAMLRTLSINRIDS